MTFLHKIYDILQCNINVCILFIVVAEDDENKSNVNVDNADQESSSDVEPGQQASLDSSTEPS